MRARKNTSISGDASEKILKTPKKTRRRKGRERKDSKQRKNELI